MIAVLAGRQHGIVTRSQLEELGLRGGAIDHRIASGYLQPVFRATFAVGHRAIGREGRMLAAVLACERGTDVVVCFRVVRPDTERLGIFGDCLIRVSLR